MQKRRRAKTGHQSESERHQSRTTTHIDDLGDGGNALDSVLLAEPVLRRLPPDPDIELVSVSNAGQMLMLG